MSYLVDTEVAKLHRQLRIERMLFQDYKRSFREFLKEAKVNPQLTPVLTEQLEHRLKKADKAFLERMRKK